MIDFFFEILDLEKVRIDTEILSLLLYTTRDTEGQVIYIFVTSVLKVNSQGEGIFLSFSEIPDLRNVEIDTMTNSAS